MPQTITFEFTKCESIPLKLDKGVYKLEAWGAGALDNGGGYASGILKLHSQTKFFLHLGSRGTFKNSFNEGGCNGGGNATNNVSGGGATDIRAIDDTLYHRILVAGGAGGSLANDTTFGGGESGGFSNNPGRGMPGTQTEPGKKCVSGNFICNPGGFGYGASGIQENSRGGGAGGGGWYGGASGSFDEETHNPLAGAGGSGYILTSTSTKPKDYQLTTMKQLFLTNGKFMNNSNKSDGKIIITSLQESTCKRIFARFQFTSLVFVAFFS